MGKVRRGGYVFVTWKGDHAPRHCHVYKDGSFVCKWDLENKSLMEGKLNRRLLRILQRLVEEGRL